MPTFYCNYFFVWNSGAPYTQGPPGLCLPCLPHCYATASIVFIYGMKLMPVIEQQLDSGPVVILSAYCSYVVILLCLDPKLLNLPAKPNYYSSSQQHRWFLSWGQGRGKKLQFSDRQTSENFK